MHEFYDALFDVDFAVIRGFNDFFAVFPEMNRAKQDVGLLVVRFPGGVVAFVRLTDCGGGKVHASVFGHKHLEIFMLYIDWLVFIFGQKRLK